VLVVLDLFLIALLLCIGFYWSNAMKAREVAFRAVKTYCHEMDLLLLDEYVALDGQWLKRDEHGKLKAWRSYQFEFSSTGDERYTGKAVMLGRQVISIQLQPYKV
jgi:hypothetical protein